MGNMMFTSVFAMNFVIVVLLTVQLAKYCKIFYNISNTRIKLIINTNNVLLNKKIDAMISC